MAEERELAVFSSGLDEEIQYRAFGSPSGAEFGENVFVDIVSEHLAEIGVLDNPVVCFHQARFGAGIVRLNGYSFQDNADRLNLLLAIYEGGGNHRTIPAADIVKAGAQAARAVQAVVRGDHKKMERASDAYSMLCRISEVLESGVREVRVFILTDGLSPVSSVQPRSVRDINFTFEVYDIRRLMRTMDSVQDREIIEIDLKQMGLESIPCVAMPAAKREYDSYLAIISGDTLFRLYEEFGPRLLEYNVRSFLQATGKVNRGIRDTIRDEPHRLMAYNNGISVTVDEITLEPGAAGLMITGFRGLQIVNGGQTTASIHRARKRDRFEISEVFVPAKITRLSPESVEEMVPRISRFANTQNVIQEADFSANEPYHIAMERLSKALWVPGEQSRWFYERSRGQYQTAMNIEGTTPARIRAFKERTPRNQRFSKTELARALNSWNRLPHVVSGGAQKNFVSFMRSLRQQRGASWEPDEAYFREAVAQLIIFSATQRIVRQEGFPAYRANITCYLVAYLAHRSGGLLDLAHVWKFQGISEELESLLRVWSHSIEREIQESSSGRNVTEWCKKEGCWAAVRDLDLPVASPACPEWGTGSRGVGPAESDAGSPDAAFAASACMRVTAEAWFALHLWGRRTGALASWQAGIAHALSGYAGGGWAKTPSQKQAAHGVRILEIAREKGFDPLSPEDLIRIEREAG